MHSRMCTTRSLTVSHAPHNHAHPPQPCMPPCNHTCPHNHACPPTMHAPHSHTHTPLQPCMPPTTTHAPPVNRITDTCKNITFPQLRLRAVKMATKGSRIVFMFLSPPLPSCWIRYWPGYIQNVCIFTSLQTNKDIHRLNTVSSFSKSHVKNVILKHFDATTIIFCTPPPNFCTLRLTSGKKFTSHVVALIYYIVFLGIL